MPVIRIVVLIHWFFITIIYRLYVYCLPDEVYVIQKIFVFREFFYTINMFVKINYKPHRYWTSFLKYIVRMRPRHFNSHFSLMNCLRYVLLNTSIYSYNSSKMLLLSHTHKTYKFEKGFSENVHSYIKCGLGWLFLNNEIFVCCSSE